MRSIIFSPLLGLVLPQLVRAQDQVFPPAFTQNNTFNASYGDMNPSSAAALIAQANLSAEFSEAILVAINFERSNWAGSSANLDPFYVDIPSNASTAPPGSVIKVEEYTNTSLYTLPPNVALKRFLYMTKTMNGTVVPASAYVLWPWLPRQFSNISGLPVVGWAHGTSGHSAECAPSHMRNLWYHYGAPFTLALQGYVVVAPDYAGLGVDHDAEGNFIPHQYLANPAAGYDLIYSIEAAQKAWPKLSKEFVLMGHSQGGGAAWGAAQHLAKHPVKGYLGTVAGSPVTRIADLLRSAVDYPAALATSLARIATGMSSIFPSFSYSDWLSEKGVTLTNLMQNLQGGNSLVYELFVDTDLVGPGWNETWYLDTFSNLTANGGSDHPFAGPMLVIEGTEDASVLPDSVTDAVNATCEAYPYAQLQYSMFEGVDHVPVMYAAQQVWLDFIADRFNRVPFDNGCQSKLYQPDLPVANYVKEQSSFLSWLEYGYEITA